VKRNHILDFLQAGSKVKATIAFRGREMAHRDLGWTMMNRLLQEISEAGQVEARPKQEGPNLTAIIAPKKPGVKAAVPQGRPASVAPAAAAHRGGTSPSSAPSAGPSPGRGESAGG
jgi:translation initiation factor IF-3